jgi:hypothetical protein
MITRVETHPELKQGRPLFDARDAAWLTHERELACGDFSHVELSVESCSTHESFVVRLDEWRSDALDSYAFDSHACGGAIDRMAGRRGAVLALSGPPRWLDEDTCAVLTRARRCAIRTNRASDGAWFRGVPARHLERGVTRELELILGARAPRRKEAS